MNSRERSQAYSLSFVESVGAKKEDGSYDKKINPGRTSTNAWCQHSCYEDDVAQRVIHRLSNLTDIPEPNSEYLQLLRYEESQFYNAHHVSPTRRAAPRMNGFCYLTSRGFPHTHRSAYVDTKFVNRTISLII